MEQLTNPDQELSTRKSDGITTSLWWKPGTSETYVTVTDDKLGEAFTVSVEAPATPNDVFNHPYAYRKVGDLALNGKSDGPR